ncbi:MAG: LacI family transcriptional regulator [Clostridiales bacterium]|nr:LacI family transcriptional regulator [Clostridiales bacterium]
MKKPGKTSISVTRDDVARLAGVAPSTVSNVINNKGNVSEKLRERIEWAIKELNYTPNMVARSLATKSTKHIGLIID